MKTNVQAKDHDNYAVMTVLTVLMPFVGFILGIVYLLKDTPVDRKLGEHLIAFSILFFIIWSVFLAFVSTGG